METLWGYVKDRDRVTFFRPETIVASFLHLTVLLFKVLQIIPQNASFWCSIVVHLRVAQWSSLKFFRVESEIKKNSSVNRNIFFELAYCFVFYPGPDYCRGTWGTGLYGRNIGGPKICFENILKIHIKHKFIKYMYFFKLLCFL